MVVHRKCVRILRHTAECLVLFFLTAIIVILIHLTSTENVHDVHSNLKLNVVSTVQSKEDRNNSPCLYPHSYSMPWYRPIINYKDITLVYFKKQNMAVASEVSRKKGWIIAKTSKTFEVLKSLVSNSLFIVIFTSSKELSSPLLQQYTNNSNILATGIPNAYKFTGTKREQYITYQNFLNTYQCSIEQLRLMPASYLMDDSIQCRNFFRNLESRKNSDIWVLKKSQGFGGDQVQVFHNTTLFKKMFGKCDNNEQYIIQEYVQNLLLLEERKFDVRALILIAGTRPYILFYHEGYLRVVLKAFDPKASREVHLTNTHVQSMQPNYSPDKHFWSFAKFQTYLDEHHPDNNEFVTSRLIPYIKKISVFILNSGLHLMDRAPSSFQLLGLDLLVSKDWHIWFIEANNYPLWPKGGWITDFTSKMGEDLFDLVIKMRQTPQEFINMPVGEWFRSWQLVWREDPPGCKLNKYNPCHEFYSLL